MSIIRSSIGRRTSDGTSGAAALELIAGARGCWIKELTIFLAAATASTYGLGRPAATGITPTTPVTSLLEGAGDDSPTVKTALAWATGPTVPAQFFRRISFPATIGSSHLPWLFANGLWIPPNTSVVLWNLAANGVIDALIVTEEPKP